MTRRQGAGGFVRRLRPSRLLFCVSAAAVAVAVTASSGSAAPRSPLARPTALQTFLQRLDEPRLFAGANVPAYSRTPSFAWAPVRGATRYEFQLSTSNQFRAENGLIWSGTTGATPATTIPVSLPWITGNPASLYWRVRAVNGGSVSLWSDAQPFSMRWASLPTEWLPDSGSPADMPGYVRWYPVDGATGYQVWFMDTNKVVTTITNVADERDYYASNPNWTGAVHWRVRAIRSTYGQAFDGLPAVSHGPWSPEYTWTNTWNPLNSGTDVRPVAAVSDRVSTPDQPNVHSLVPALLFAGGGTNEHDVYVFSDSDCVNPVYPQGSVVAGPAYAPRTNTVPATTSELVYGNSASAVAKVDLWDRDWPGGRYDYAVVPFQNGQDTELPQDACQANRVLAFGKHSVDATPTPQAVGLSPNGRLLAGATSRSWFYGSPLVTWTAAPAASGYDVEWSRNLYPWHPAGRIHTPATSALLPVGQGTWWYRVRGINPSLPGNTSMTWSQKVRIHIAAPTYSVIGG
ncbi:MAG: hypothetical protein JO363_00510 [Solirubrobacterales bacterium]|nr:hypothetical protein [Solirubrobacterales bacterium]